MNHSFDIRDYKKTLRSRYKAVRKGIEPYEKLDKDKAILTYILNMPEYKSCKSLLSYVSVPDEVDTRELISNALSEGKTVAVPRCINGSRDMDFFVIKSLDELRPGTMGILEPFPENNKKITDFRDSLCILPGLAFDAYGYRLGYGGGYYDRFLAEKFNGVTAGICYHSCTLDKLRLGRHDVPCEFLITEYGCKRSIKSDL